MLEKGQTQSLGRTYHLVASANEDSDRTAVGTFFNDQHLLSCCAKSHLAHTTSSTKLLCAQILKSRHDTAIGGNCNQLDLGTTDPSDGGQLVLKEQVVGLIVETPLTDDEVGSRILQLLNHLSEFVLLVFLELLELLDRSDIELMLGFGLRRLEGAGQDGQLGILYLIGHLGVREILVDDNTIYEQRVLEGTTDFAIHLDQFEVNVPALQIRNRQHGIHGDLGELVMRLGNTVIGSDKAESRLDTPILTSCCPNWSWQLYGDCWYHRV